MNRYDKRIWALAAGLSGLAGFVDATGFITLDGFFVSFMSGNSTRLGVGLARGSWQALLSAGLIATFVAGVVLGSLTGHVARRHRRPAVLVLAAALLSGAAAASQFGATTVAIAAMVLAMGVENAVFERDGDIHIGLTYMTGTLVKAGQRMAAALLGGDRLAWLPYLLLWLGLIAGAVAGAAIYPYLGMHGLWIAAGAAALFAAIAARL